MALATVADLAVPVRRVRAGSPNDFVRPGLGWPELDEVEVDRLLSELVVCAGVAPAGVDPHSVASGRQLEGTAVLAGPRHPAGLCASADGNRDLDDVLPLLVVGRF